MPLAPGVRAFSGQSRGMFQLWTASLAELLRQGVSLPDAIESLPRLASRPSTLLIRMGYESGDLPAGLREATAARSSRLATAQDFWIRIAYLVGVLFVAQSIVGFIMYFIVPKIEAIFKDFGIDLPEMTIFVIRMSHFLVEYAWIVFLPATALIAYMPFYLFGASDAGFPLVDRLFPRRHTILILRALAVVVESGRPIGPAFRAMAQWYPTSWVRRRIEKAAEYAEQGVDWPETLESLGLLGRAEAGVLQAASRAGNLPWALRELSESGERRRAYRLQVWSQLLFVLTILAVGLMVFLISVAFFMPLTTLIMRLAR